MRKIYLIRHCEPDFSKIRKDYETAGTICLGTGDPPLSFVGRMRAVLVGEWIRALQVTAVFCSTKKRSRETALAIASNAQTVKDLHEIGMGIWEGMSMDEIRVRYPDIYEARGKIPYSVYPEGGEAPADALARFSQALVRIISESRGDVAVVAHGGVNRLLLTKMLGRDMEENLSVKQDYGCVNTISGDGGTLTVEALNETVRPSLSDDLCERLLKAAGTPDDVRAHCRAVAARCDEIADAMSDKNVTAIDKGLLHAAAMLHDLLRTEEDHAQRAAALLDTLGYPEIAKIIASHHDLPENAMQEANMQAALYLADKQTKGTQRVSIGARFAESLAKCETEEARENHAIRYAQAKQVERLFR
ncbi:MAG: histidine phosphatase family protein [Lachnospiraceae bacterium]|nr:histidine phosphatase family protein [Lachnospiraceae bacterium]